MKRSAIRQVNKVVKKTFSSLLVVEMAIRNVVLVIRARDRPQKFSFAKPVICLKSEWMMLLTISVFGIMTIIVAININRMASFVALKKTMLLLMAKFKNNAPIMKAKILFRMATQLFSG